MITTWMNRLEKKLNVAIDLDGVIWDLVDPWVKVYNELYNDTVNVNEILEYDLSKSLLKASRPQLLQILCNKDFWDTVYPFEYSQEYLEKINNRCNLYIATKTDYRILEVKVERLLKLFPFITSEQVICIQDKYLLDVDWLIDDCIDNLILGNFNKILLDASYNRYNNYFIRAKNLKDVYNIIWS